MGAKQTHPNFGPILAGHDKSRQAAEGYLRLQKSACMDLRISEPWHLKGEAMGVRILFVDDERGIRLTLPAILESHGYEVTAAATVGEALAAVSGQKFQVLIADLNIGEPGDGFTVVSAMRRTQPECVNFILTGYPAFETALQAIRSQVDDYLVKPAEIQSLVDAIEQKLKSPRAAHAFAIKSISTVMRENLGLITEKTLKAMKAHPELKTVRMTDVARVDHIPGVVEGIANQLEAEHPDSLNEAVLKAASAHGRERREQGYSLPLLAEDTSMLDIAIYEVIQDNLLSMNVSSLVPHLRRVNRSLDLQLGEAIKAFLAGGRKAA